MTKQEIIEISKKIGELLKKYAVVHDKAFAFSLKHLISFKFIRPINYNLLFKDASEIYREMDIIGDKIKYILDNNELSISEKVYCLSLDTYLDALANAVSLSSDLFNRLDLKSNSLRKLSWSEYNSLMKEYNSAILEYQKLGRDLNPLYYEMLLS